MTLADADLAAIPNHDGTPRARGDRFFSLPDPRIGTLRSASTSERTPRVEGPGESMVLRLLFSAMAGLAPMILLGGGRGQRWAETPASSWCVGIAVALLVFWVMGPDRRCSYVGDKGLWLAWRQFRVVPRRRVFLFEDAWEVGVAYTRVYKPGYRGTNARFTWVDDEGRRVFEIDTAFGEYHLDDDAIDLGPVEHLPPEHPMVVALATVAAFHAFIEADNAELSTEEHG